MGFCAHERVASRTDALSMIESVEMLREAIFRAERKD